MKNNRDNERRIFGPPGTGKTTYLIKQITLATEQTDPKNILVASFTKAAAEELASRGLPIPRENVGTLHAICFRALGQPELAEPNIKKFNEAYPDYAIKSTSSDSSESGLDQYRETKGDELYSQLQIYRAKMIPKTSWLSSVRGFAHAWEAFKAEYQLLDFTDLIERATEDMIFTPNNTTIGIFDEVQDFTALEMRLIRRWGCQFDYFLLAGDDDQCLYNFTGASSEAFLFPDIPMEHKRFLTQSYRVPRRIQALAQKIIERVQVREPKEYKPRDVEGSIFRIRATYKHPQEIIRQAEGHVKAGKSVMILSSCAYMLNGIIAKLRDENIPFSNVYKKSRGDWNPLTPGNGVSSMSRLQAYINPMGPKYGEMALWSPLQISLWMDLVKVKGIFVRGAKKIIKEKLSQKDISDDEYLDMLIEAFTPEGLDEAVKLKTSWLLEHAIGQKAKALRFPISILSKYGNACVDMANKLTIGTIHSVKGAQADVVILLPDLSMQAARQYILKSGEGYDSVLRQFYVAVTRSRDTLIITSPVNPRYYFKSF